MEYVNVIAAALGAYAFSAVWYTAMSRPWMRAAGIPMKADGKPDGNGSPMPFLYAFVAMLVVAGTMRHVFVFAGITTIAEGAGAGAGIGAFFISAWVGMNYGFSMRPLNLWLIDTVNAVVGCTVMGVILMAF